MNWDIVEGNWKQFKGNVKEQWGKLTDDDLTMIPVYIGVGDEANQGLCTGTENYWCVNKEADQADICLLYTSDAADE